MILIQGFCHKKLKSVDFPQDFGLLESVKLIYYCVEKINWNCFLKEISVTILLKQLDY